jgi:hypothetical protein
MENPTGDQNKSELNAHEVGAVVKYYRDLCQKFPGCKYLPPTLEYWEARLKVAK